MNMDKEKAIMKQKLEEELKDVSFTTHQSVLSKLERKGWKENLNDYLNREIELNVVPLSFIVLLTILPISFKDVIIQESKNQYASERKIIEIAGNVYWEDQLEGKVSLYENQNEN